MAGIYASDYVRCEASLIASAYLLIIMWMGYATLLSYSFIHPLIHLKTVNVIWTIKKFAPWKKFRTKQNNSEPSKVWVAIWVLKAEIIIVLNFAQQK